MNITTEQIEQLFEQHREELFEEGFVELFTSDSASVHVEAEDGWYEFTVQDSIDGRQCKTPDASVVAHVLNLFLQ